MSSSGLSRLNLRLKGLKGISKPLEFSLTNHLRSYIMTFDLKSNMFLIRNETGEYLCKDNKFHPEPCQVKFLTIRRSAQFLIKHPQRGNIALSLRDAIAKYNFYWTWQVLLKPMLWAWASPAFSPSSSPATFPLRVTVLTCTFLWQKKRPRSLRIIQWESMPLPLPIRLKVDFGMTFLSLMILFGDWKPLDILFNQLK